MAIDYDSAEDIVITTRVRMARNIQGYKFPNTMTDQEADLLTEKIVEIFKEEDYSFNRIKDMKLDVKKALVEDHLISPALMDASAKGGFLLRGDKKATVMLNEEDHIRTQVILPGHNLEEAWSMANRIDDLIEKDLDYAFHEKYGYLTSCPTNVGTGLRASFMVHLPALTLTNNIDGLVGILGRIGLTIRGLYGEGSKGIGALYQISNQTTLGQSEEEIMRKLDKVINQVINREREMRVYLRINMENQLEDRVYRSLGILKFNRQISSREAMRHLSNVKLGIDMGILEEMDSEEIIDLMRRIQPASLQLARDKKLKKEERDIERSILIREVLN